MFTHLIDPLSDLDKWLSVGLNSVVYKHDFLIYLFFCNMLLVR